MFSFTFSPANKKKPDHNKNMNSGRPRPRLERRNAAKNIDYDALAASATFPAAAGASSPSSPETLRTTRSLDLSPSYSNQTSFRIGGSIEGEVDFICRSLGLSGPEDFAISTDAWEACRAQRSSFDLLPRSRLSPASRDLYSHRPEADVARFQDSTAGVSENGGIKGVRPPTLAPPEMVTRLAPPTAAAKVSISEIEPVRKTGSGDGGIKGVRPPTLTPPETAVMSMTTQSTPLTMSPDPSPSSVLAPPPSISLPELEKVGSTWDLVRSFAPDDGQEEKRRRSFQSEEEEEEDAPEEEVRVRLGGETSEDVASTSNDDDSSSMAMEAMLIISPNGRFKRKFKSWMRGHLLGSGSFGTVYEGISDDGFFFAVKEVSLLDQGSNAQQCIIQLEQEIALLSQFEHENIVQYYGTDKEEAKLFIFIELVTQGSLASLYQKYRLQDSQVSAYTRQILKGLIYLHERNVVHRDIKCANILVHANGSVKLADFGLAKQITKINKLKSCKGSVYWMAPEVVKVKRPYGPAADIWSLGCTVLEMLTQKIPYPDMEWDDLTCHQIYRTIGHLHKLEKSGCITDILRATWKQHVFFMVGRGETPRIPTNLSKDARDFITQCVQANPADRPTASQLLEHPFVRRPLPFLGSSPDYSSSPANNRWN